MFGAAGLFASDGHGEPSRARFGLSAGRQSRPVSTYVSPRRALQRRGVDAWNPVSVACQQIRQLQFLFLGVPAAATALVLRRVYLPTSTRCEYHFTRYVVVDRAK